MAVRDFIVHELGEQIDAKLTHPTSGGKVGDPGLVGDMPCILYTDQDAEGKATVRFQGVFRFLVHGANGAGNAAIAANAAGYYDTAPGASNPHINADDTNGSRFGTILDAVSSGAKTVVRVRIHR
jgi:hypothetical protein